MIEEIPGTDVGVEGRPDGRCRILRRHAPGCAWICVAVLEERDVAAALASVPPPPLAPPRQGGGFPGEGLTPEVLAALRRIVDREGAAPAPTEAR